MKIRAVKMEDAEQLIPLLDTLDYPNTEGFIRQKIRQIIDSPNEYCFVAEDDQAKVAGFISISIILQIALQGDFARIGYFAVAEGYRSQGVGQLLEAKCVEVAQERQCDRIELHCAERRTRAQQFYDRQGYVESPKYLMKKQSVV